MYQVGELIVYGTSGVCQVDAVGPQPARTGNQQPYYTLRPLHGTETIYTPVDSRVAMRPVLTKNEADALILQFPSLSAAPISGANTQLLAHSYQHAFQSNQCADLVRLLKAIHAKDDAARRQGRRPGKVEDRYRKRAEELLYQELSVALGLPEEEVPRYIRRQLAGAPQEAG